MSLNLCVVGCGQFAKTFVKAIRFSSVPGVADQTDLFFASRDREKAKAKAYCRKFAGRGYFGSYEEAAADPKVEAMYICTPHNLHAEHAVLAARFSKHILVEKPIARTLEEGQRMIAAAEDAGVKLMVAENYRFMPVVQKAKELITQGAIGTLRLIQIQEEARYVVEGWRTRREIMGGGVLIDGGVHSINILVSLAGMPLEVYAAGHLRGWKIWKGRTGWFSWLDWMEVPPPLLISPGVYRRLAGGDGRISPVPRGEYTMSFATIESPWRQRMEPVHGSFAKTETGLPIW